MEMAQDADPMLPCTDADHDLYDDSNPSQPCDNDNAWDAYDWNMNGDHTDDNQCPDGEVCPEYMSMLSTCTGCGIRQGTEILSEFGRPNGVWVIVFLSDGIANLSDTHDTNPNVPASFNYGYCGDYRRCQFVLAFFLHRLERRRLSRPLLCRYQQLHLPARYHLHELQQALQRGRLCLRHGG